MFFYLTNYAIEMIKIFNRSLLKTKFKFRSFRPLSSYDYRNKVRLLDEFYYHENSQIIHTIKKQNSTINVNRSTKIIENIQYVCEYMWRLFEYFYYGGKIGGLVILQKIVGKSEKLDNLMWNVIISSLNSLGPLFVKFGQWMSTRPDLFSYNVIQKLSELQDSVKTQHNINEIENFLIDLYGENWKSFIEYNPKTIGSGSIGSVFKGTMNVKVSVNCKLNFMLQFCVNLFGLKQPRKIINKKTDIVIKAINTDCKKQILTDMYILNHIAKYVDSLDQYKSIEIGNLIRNFSSLMNTQLNLTNEGENLLKFNKNFENEKNIIFPKFVGASENILIETYIDAIPLKTVISNKKYSYYYEQISNTLLDSVIKMFFVDNFIHGDLHPGNIMVKIDENNDSKIIILDSGITYNFSTNDSHKKITNIAFLLMLHKGYKAGLLLIERSLKEQLEKIKSVDDIVDNNLKNADQFCRGIEEIVENSKKENVFSNASVYTDRLLKHARKSNIKLDSELLQLMLALKVVEGIFLSLTPDMTMINNGTKLLLKRIKFSKIKMSEILEIV